MTPDLDKYRKHVAELGLSEGEENALLQSLWRIMEGFADNAFGLNPVQAACGQLEENSSKPALRAPNEVSYLHKIIADEFIRAAGEDQQRKTAHETTE
jgi:hypothetical protein